MVRGVVALNDRDDEAMNMTVLEHEPSWRVRNKQ